MSRSLTMLAFLVAAAACAPMRAVAQRNASPARGIARTSMPRDSTGRLMSLARIWGEAKYFHPALATPTVNWDSIGAAAIRATKAASTADAFADAVNEMLGALNDPITRVVALRSASRSASRESSDATLHETPIPPSAEWITSGRTDSVLVFVVGSELGTMRRDSARYRLAALHEAVARARRVLVDLRGTDVASSSAFTDLLDGSRIDRALLGRSLCGVAPRSRMYVGFPAPNVIGPDLFTGSQQPDAPCFQAGSTVRKQGVVFLIDSMSAIPSIALSMQAAGLATIASTGPVTDAALVALDTIPLAPGLGVQMRLSARPTCSKLGELADTVLMLPPYAQRQNDYAIEMASALTQHARPVRKCGAAPMQPVAGPAAALADTALPASEWRVLAAFQIYNAIRFFDPHTDLIAGQNWDSVVTSNIPAIEGAATRHDYRAAISRFVAALNDGHAVNPGSRLLNLFGYAFPPVLVRVIEGRLVVVENFDSSAAPGVHPGDILVSVDGEDARSRFVGVRQYIPASTPASRDAIASQFFLAGPEGSVATLVTESANGRRDTAHVPRRQKYVGRVFGFGREHALRLLPGNVGYVDLSVLSQPSVDSMFERFGHTRALILDVRSYPRGTHFLIASRLARIETVAARIRTPIVSAPDQNVPRVVVNGLAVSTGSYVEETQRVIPDGRPPYPGRVYVIMDERSISQSEQAALVYKIAGHAILVGSNTAGADGDATSFIVPGHIGIAFTGAEVRAPDGTPIQGVGLTPDVRVEPTIAGIRAGRDELLDCALRLATTNTRTCNPSRK